MPSMILRSACCTPSPDTSRVIEGLSDLRRNLVDFVDVDDAALGPLDIVVGRLQQFQDDVFDVLADIARFGERRGVGHGEGHVEDAGQRLGQQRLAGAGGAHEQDVGLGQFHVIVLGGVVQALVVIVDGNGQDLLGVDLADDIIIENFADFLRRRHAVLGFDQRRLVLFADDVHAEFDAFIADEYGRSGNQLADLMLALSAEGAIQACSCCRPRLPYSCFLLEHSGWHCISNIRAKPLTGYHPTVTNKANLAQFTRLNPACAARVNQELMSQPITTTH